jgi:hypothetical protein
MLNIRMSRTPIEASASRFAEFKTYLPEDSVTRAFLRIMAGDQESKRPIFFFFRTTVCLCAVCVCAVWKNYVEVVSACVKVRVRECVSHPRPLPPPLPPSTSPLCAQGPTHRRWQNHARDRTSPR